MSSIHHIYLTFNPFLNSSYEKGYSQCHEFYDLLKTAVNKDKTAGLWWGKIIGKDRDSTLKLEVLQKVLGQNKEHGLSTHLFITDFQNLWVGKIRSVAQTLPKGAQSLSFYADKKVEVWFELSDFFLLEHDTEETAKKLSELYIDNEYSSLKVNGLSPFTTGVKYPCVVQDLAEEQFFDELDDQESSHLVLKENPAIGRSSAGMVLKAIHLYLFPEEMYAKLPHAAKLEIEAAELDMLESRHHNLQQMTFSYLKALEVVMNDLTVHHIKRKGLAAEFFVDATAGSPKLYMNETKDCFVPLKTFNKNFSLGNLFHFLERGERQNVPSFRQAFADHKLFLQYCLKELEPLIRNNRLIELRNSLAHGDAKDLTLRDAMAVRNLVLGCGPSGIIYNCYRTFYQEKFRHLAELTETVAKDEKKAKLKLVG